MRLWDEWMQRKLKGVADPDQEPLGGPSREQSPLERGSSGGPSIMMGCPVAVRSRCSMHNNRVSLHSPTRPRDLSEPSSSIPGS